MAAKIDLPYEKRFTLIYKDGRRVPCVVAVKEPEKGDDGLYHGLLECRQVFPSGFRRQEATVGCCLVGLFQGLREVMRGMEFACEEEDGQPFEFPCGNEIDPAYPTDEELNAFAAQLRAQARDTE